MGRKMSKKLVNVPTPEKIAQVLKEFGIKEPHPLQIELLSRFFRDSWVNKDGLVVYMFSTSRGKFYLAKDEPYAKRRLLLHTLTILEKFGIITVRKMRDPITKSYRKYIFMPNEVAEKFLS